VVFFRTGSRGGMLALVAMLMAGFVRLSHSRKALSLLLLLLAIPMILALAPKSLRARYLTIIFKSSSLDLEEVDTKMLVSAEGSGVARTALLMDSLQLTMHHPIFGVGPGQFVVSAADEAKAIGKKASWHATHNSYTQVSSEMGLVGLVFYLGMLLTTGRDLRRVRNSVAGIPHLRSLNRMASCLFVSWVGYCVFSFFDAVAYMQYVPILAAMSFCLKSSAKRELQTVASATVRP
jgi:O-antigen ligase